MIFNKLINRHLLLLVLIATATNSCKAQDQGLNNGQEFNNYWLSGKAELCSYKLSQARYSELHEGTAVLIFVTEDFSKSKQVKLDNPERDKTDAVKVLKLNKMRQFNTGVYNYSIMLSSFTTIDYTKFPHTLKVTCTSQDWCGHTFSQLNTKKDQYNHLLYSYFEKEGDDEQLLPITHLEDELWQQIRINPNDLPQGKLNLIPGLEFARLKHVKLTAKEAVASLNSENGITTYEVKYTAIQRTLKIMFESKFPYKIIGWEEIYSSGFGPNKKELTTKATLTNSLKLDYWNHNQLKDSTLRKQLFLKPE